jgi:hypothetical protein
MAPPKVVYMCPRCGYTTPSSTCIRNHFRAKKLCYPTLHDVPKPSPDHIDSCRVGQQQQQQQQQQQSQHNDLMVAQAFADMSKQLADFVNRFNALELHNKHLQEQNRHLYDMLQEQTHRFEDKMQEQTKRFEDKMQEQGQCIKQLQDGVNAIVSRPSSTTTHNITNNVNIIVNDLCRPDLSHMPAEKVQQLFLGMTTGLLTLIKDVFFNPSIPQNHSLRLTSKKKKMAKIRERGAWVPICMSDGIEKTIDLSTRIICNRFISDVQYADYIMSEHDMLHTWCLQVGSKCHTVWRPLRNAVKCNLIHQYDEERRISNSVVESQAASPPCSHNRQEDLGQGLDS